MAVLADRLALNQTPFVSMVNGDVYIYSAIARKSSNHSFFDVISLNGWEYSPLRKSTYNCCLYYDDNVQSAPLLDKLHWNFVGHAKLETKQFQCPNPRHTYHKLPLAISLTLNKCPDEKTVVVPVETPYKVNNTRADNLAVCTKLAFGNLSASKMIEWFEVQKLLGVSKTMTYTHKLNADAMKVLEHYKSEGLAEYHPFELPGTGISFLHITFVIHFSEPLKRQKADEKIHVCKISYNAELQIRRGFEDNSKINFLLLNKSI